MNIEAMGARGFQTPRRNHGWVKRRLMGLTVVLPSSRTLLVVGIPVLMLLSSSGELPPLFSIGDATIQVYDLLLVAIMLKVVLVGFFFRQKILVSRAELAAAVFLSVLLAATLLAYYSLGVSGFVGELPAFLRLAAQVSVFFLLGHVIRTRRDLGEVSRLLDGLGYFLAGIIYLNLLLFSAGVRIGEVQVTERTIRSFGFAGDPVGFLLVFFILKHLIGRRVVPALFHAGALVATGTFGALVTLLTGLALLALLARPQRAGRLVHGLLYGVIVSSVVGLLAIAGIGGLRARFAENTFYEFSVKQRVLTASFAWRVFLDHPVTGVGYSGFRYVALDYGASDVFATHFQEFVPSYVATAANQYLQTATDGGVIALGVFLWMLVIFAGTLSSVARRLDRRLRILPHAAYIWFLSLLIGNQTAVWLLPGSLISYLLWIVLGWTVAAKRLRHSYGPAIETVHGGAASIRSNSAEDEHGHRSPADL